MKQATITPTSFDTLPIPARIILRRGVVREMQRAAGAFTKADVRLLNAIAKEKRR